MISGRSSDTTYEQTENLKPGKTSSVTAAPPRTWRRSRTRTFFPAFARYAAWTRPLCPPPMTMTSYRELMRSEKPSSYDLWFCGGALPRARQHTYNPAPRQGPRARVIRATADRIRGRKVPIGTAVHERTFPLCESLNYREWSGYYAVSAYEAHHEHEYNAIRNAAALIDISPLFKYRLSGKDATRLVDRIITRDVRKIGAGSVVYTPWCDEHGKTIDDGTVSRLEENVYRWTAADPSLRWFHQNALGLDVKIEDISEQLAALALQGPTSGRLLRAVAEADVENLKYFKVTSGKIAGIPVDISRTGYTGDLGYEIWVAWTDAVKVWDELMTKGKAFDIHAAGMLALDVSRIEAGLLLIDVDFFGSKKAFI